MSHAAPLFQPFSFKGLHLANRIVMAPMTRSFSPEGVPTAQVSEYYRKRAASAVGLIVSEGTVVQRPSAGNDPHVPHFWGDDALGAWQNVINTVHAAGGVMAPQLWHVGAARNRNTEWTAPPPVDSPSGLSRPGKQFGEPMTDAAIADTIAAFAKAAGAAKRLGFDCIELHGAHGYLIDQFFWDGTNQRTDKYGGDLVARGVFAAEILKAVRAEVGPDYPVIIRLSQWKQQDYAARIAQSPDEMAAWLQPLADAGADIFHCSQRRFWEPEFEGSDLNFAGWAKKLTGRPTITVGSVGLSGEFIAAFGGESSKPASLDELLRRFDRGDFDLVAVGRALISDPDWALKVRDGRTDELSNFSPPALAELV
ncbi:MAG: NADH:flavin oxidoreductase [Rhodoferax sp.]|nr:NADH:flavin oxidoreductase [Rhodoferax sp.]